jgi:hypothetical protein
MLVPNPKGGYSFLPGIDAYSSGVVAEAGFEIVHATFRRLFPYPEGFNLIEGHLQAKGRGREALCAVELRSPAPFTRAGFAEFNRDYHALLEEWGVLVEGQNPVARTNVAPRWLPPREPSLYAFSYTVPADEATGPTFVVAGAGELRGGRLEEAGVVRPGDTSPNAMREKASYVVKAISRRLDALGASWEEVTATSVYSIQPLDEIAGPVVLNAIGPAAVQGLRWYHARPPIDELEYEMDARGVRRETYL